MYPMRKSSSTTILIATLALVIAGAVCGIWKWQISETPALRTANARLQADLQGVAPHFTASAAFDMTKLSPEDTKIHDDVVAVLAADKPENAEYYSQIWVAAVGKRYILVSQPSAESSYDMILDAKTGKSGTIEDAASYVHYYPASATAKQAALYIGAQDIYTYMLDTASFLLVPGSHLSGTETYHSGEADVPSVIPHQNHTDDSITITVFDSAIRMPNPALGQGATKNGVAREATLALE